MTGHLLFGFLMSCFSETEGQAVPPPKLAVSPLVIAGTDSVTVNCQTPSSVSQCYFYIGRENPAKRFSCLQTLTGTELLLMSRQSSPAEVEVTCFYLDIYQSPQSNMASITIGTVPPSELAVSPLVIRETDSVTVNCQTPSSVSQCYFYIGRETPAQSFSCLQTLTGTELLLMSRQSSPAEVEVTCFYLDIDQSPQSNMASITIGIPPPELAVSPLVIRETDSVTVNCQTPSSVSQCYFYIGRENPAQSFSCLQTLTGTELLLMSRQSSPAEVEVTCFYLDIYQSPQSNMASITIGIPPPKLAVSPLVITGTDSVTVNCQTPSSVSQCYFYIGRENPAQSFSCLQTLTGTELLLMSGRSSPAEVEVTCYYTIEHRGRQYQSPPSDTSSITVHSQIPEVSFQQVDSDLFIFTCFLPGSAHDDTRCNLYFGEARRPVVITTIWKKRTSATKQRFCQFIFTSSDLQTHLQSVKQEDASCDYSLGNEPNSLSPRSERYSLTDIVERESIKASMNSAFTVTPGETVSRSVAPTSVTPVEAASDIVERESIQASMNSAFTVTTGEIVSRSVAPTSVTPVEAASDIVERESIQASTNSAFTVTTGVTVSRSVAPTSVTPVEAASDIVEKESSTTQTLLTFTTDVTVSRPPASTPLTPVTSAVKPTSGDTITEETKKTWMWKLVVVTAFGVGVGVVLLGLTLLCTKRTEGSSYKRKQDNVPDELMCMKSMDNGRLILAGNDEGYAEITSVPGANFSTNCEMLNSQEPQSDDLEIYHVYATISEEPTASDLTDMVYSTLEAQ
ncbi:uncharacterized protein LOC113130132 [Mastacembelus armatus]|uniref:uncharacterized protein LOC113130132 n=1 Tax=Mastacembelus armatus TaxID=205130 RepID=UPI000E461247|nr:uncharacterized protein LOC113130132 [Mastacembelus armatus]XP_033181087.1 uncharacterized protein LOC113130132 [Mastacembelus armatus]